MILFKTTAVKTSNPTQLYTLLKEAGSGRVKNGK
jgi:hypothetical protein